MLRLDPPSPVSPESPSLPDSPPLFRAQTATVTFSGEKDGRIRVRSTSLGDEAKVVMPGELVEVRLGPQGVELRIVPGMRRRPEILAAIERAEDPYDGDAAKAVQLRQLLG